FLPYVYLNEVIGRSLVAPRVFGCQAPDTGNAEILHEFGTPEQKARWLRPLVAAEIRSFFAMTEPEVSGADPLGLRARAERPGDGFRIAQKRLGPGRIHHVMRWLGQMQRAFDLMCDRALTREAFGSALADKQTIQNWIADSAAEIQACRLLTLQAAHRLDEGD